MLHQFGLRSGSAGVGKWRGGEGVVREIEMLEPMQVSILSEVSKGKMPVGSVQLTRLLGSFQRRTRQPYGLEGGGPGALGKNTWIKQLRDEDGDLDEQNPSRTREVNIGGKATVWMGKGDKLLIETPGGGAWGVSEDDQKNLGQGENIRAWEPRGSFAERAAAQAGF